MSRRDIQPGMLIETGFVPSLDNADYGLSISLGTGMTGGDLFLAMGISGFSINNSARLVGGLGLGNGYMCPVIKASYDSLKCISRHAKAMQPKNILAPDLFDLNDATVTRYDTPDDMLGVHPSRMELIETTHGFGGMRLQWGMHHEFHAEPVPICWLYGPDNAEYAAQIGRVNYTNRRTIFSKPVQAAADDAMQNPLFLRNRPDLISHGRYQDFYDVRTGHPFVTFSEAQIAFADKIIASECRNDEQGFVIRSVINPYHVLAVTYTEGNGDLSICTRSFGPADKDIKDGHAISLSTESRSQDALAVSQAFASATAYQPRQKLPVISATVLDETSQRTAEWAEPVYDKAALCIYQDNSGLIGIQTKHTDTRYAPWDGPVVWTNDPALTPVFDHVQSMAKQSQLNM